LRKCLLIVLFLALHCARLHSQLQVKNFFNVTGRRDVPVNVIIQDRNGFLWLGTAEGLFRFDGRDAEPVLAEHGAQMSSITALHLDSENRLYIGTANGKVYSFFRDRLDSLNLTPFKISERVTSFYSHGEVLVVGTYGQGILISRRGELIHFTHTSGLSDDVVYSMAGHDGDRVWCGTDAGISEIDLTKKLPGCTVISSKDGLPDNIVRLLRFEGTRLLVAMQDSGLCHLDPASKKFDRDPFFAAWSLGPVLNAHTVDREHLIATEREGIIRISDGNFSIHHYEEAGVKRVNCVFFDNTRQVWIGTQKGLSRLSEKRIKMIGHEEGLSDTRILALAVDNDNVIWVGTAAGMARVMYDDKGRVVVKDLPEFSKYSISCATKGPQGHIWFGTYGSGIIIPDGKEGKTRIINHEHGLPNDNISSIHFSAGGLVYVSTLGGGLAAGRLAENGQFSVTTIYTEQQGLGSDYVYQAITDNGGRLYAATDGGGLEVLQNGRFVNLTQRFRAKSNSVFSLCVDRNNTVWAVSNADGVLRFDERGLKALSRKEGLRDDQPAQLMASGDVLYAFHDKGIDRINGRNNSIGYYDVPESESEPNLNAIYQHNDRIYSGTNNGILVLRTSKLAADSAGPTVYIRSLNVNFRKYDLDSANIFGHDQNYFAFQFAGAWLRDPDKLSYRYMLRGLEKDWETASEGKTVNYNNLRPGTYTFVVQSKNEEDVWSEPATFEFTVLTPIWMRWWFWVIVLFAVALGIWLFVKYRLHALQKENLVLESRVKERTYEIEKQSNIIEKKNRELEQLSLVASKTDNVVLILDASGKLEYVNESFIRQHNMSFAEVKEKYGETIYDLSNNPDIRGIVSQAVDHRKSVTYESLNRKEEAGLGKWQASTLTPIFGEDGSLRKIIIIDSDVTERKKQEQIIFQKNKDITDSIYYAKKIQHAILPADELIRQYIPEHFILYMTKDIVSGDFYWFSHFRDFSIIAAVDCTGHGVPGAFMSLIGYNLLNRIVNEERITDPAEILLQLNKGLILALHKNDSESRDGMDIAICKISPKARSLEFAGAMRPLWIINNGELTEIRADKIPIGTRQRDREEQIRYTTHSVPIRPGDRFFIFTDGYADQFGGDKDKKYSSARFKTILCNTSHMSFREQEEILRNEHHFWRGEVEQIDDILVIGFSVKLPAPSAAKSS
jgi:PAS domain S-box-containing protein